MKTEQLLREAKNDVCNGGHLNKALNAILATNQPDAIFAILTELAHRSVDIGFCKALYANDPLITAAPDLLEAAIKARQTIDILWLSHHANRSDAAIESLDAAISKAKGIIRA